MKQPILLSQWMELNKDQKWTWLNIVYNVDIIPNWFENHTLKEIEWAMDNVPRNEAIAMLPDISQMIEFLGEDLLKIINENPSREERRIQKSVFNEEWVWIVCTSNPVFTEVELVDALWEAVKYKLNNQIYE